MAGWTSTETWTYTASTIAVAGQYVNNGTVVGTPVTETGGSIPGTTTVTDTDIDHHFGAVPGVNIVKLTNGTDNNSPTGPVVPVGSTVTFTYIVTNTGNVPLAGVVVTDDKGVTVSGPAPGGDADGDGRLDVDGDLDLHRFHDCGGGPVREQRHGRRHAGHRDGRNHSGYDHGDRHGHRSPLRRGAGREHREADQRHGQQQPDGARRAGGQHGDLHLHRHQYGQRSAGERGGDGRQGRDRQRSRAGRRRRRGWPAGRDGDLDLHRFHDCRGGPVREQRHGRRHAGHRDGRSRFRVRPR